MVLGDIETVRQAQQGKQMNALNIFPLSLRSTSGIHLHLNGPNLIELLGTGRHAPI
jgi:hypothetical protein